MGNYPTQEIPDYLTNYWTDFETNPPTLVVGQLQYHPSLGYMRVPFNNQHAQIQIEYDVSNNPIYLGSHRDPNAATSDLNWVISKYTWSAGVCVSYKTLVGDWDSRTGLAW
jgi:hypothetical protein